MASSNSLVLVSKSLAMVQQGGRTFYLLDHAIHELLLESQAARGLLRA
ncbi:MAG TPA: hypothetical protein VME43_32195 [Bryobacteraceae bacterium]|nr:hypothetical protein [Bryobacteraceae bacterium]